MKFKEAREILLKGGFKLIGTQSDVNLPMLHYVHPNYPDDDTILRFDRRSDYEWDEHDFENDIIDVDIDGIEFHQNLSITYDPDDAIITDEPCNICLRGESLMELEFIVDMIGSIESLYEFGEIYLIKQKEFYIQCLPYIKILKKLGLNNINVERSSCGYGGISYVVSLARTQFDRYKFGYIEFSMNVLDWKKEILINLDSNGEHYDFGMDLNLFEKIVVEQLEMRNKIVGHNTFNDYPLTQSILR